MALFGTSQWALVFLWLVLVDSWPLHPLPPHEGIVKNTYIGYYGAAWYDTSALRKHRNRPRRHSSGAVKNQPFVLDLRALDRLWRMNLVRDTTVFTDDVTFENTNGTISFDTLHSYVGTLEGDDKAIVQGIVTSDGLFDGSVITAVDEFYFEPTSRYLSRLSSVNTSPAYHTIAYKASDIINPSLPRECQSKKLHRSKLFTSEIQSNSSNKQDTDDTLFEPMFNHFKNLYKIKNDNKNIKNRTTRHLQKRATVDPRKTTCMLYLQADHQFFSRYGTEEACIEVMTRHVQRVNSIYKRTDFNQDGRADNISFMIKRIKVHNGDSLTDSTYRFPGNYGVEKYLELFSEEDYDAFCLAYMFTYRDFEMGTLGLAWTGDLKNAGGVCEKNGHYRGSMKSLNTGIVTLLNYGKHVPPAVSHVTLAHEIGHNFGSPHDPEQCTPGGDDGNFIMFARATSGDKRNNNRFSPCSLTSINPVLNTKARSPKGCFTEPQESLCGNGVVEEGEECDCGWEDDCRDTCCFPQRRYPPANEKPCTLTPGSICSPSQGPCCANDCKLKFSDKCREDNGCRDASFCDGRTPHCPASINKPNKTICNREFVCFMGECTGSICLAYGLESCQCIPGPNDPVTKACELCCQLPGGNQPCLSSFKWNSPPYDVPDMFSKPGTPCNNYNGYCDVFQKCREVDPSGPLATLRKLLLSEESLATFRQWTVEHWYAVAFLCFAVILFVVTSIRFLSKQPNPKLKTVTIIHSSTTETVRLPPEGAEGITIHPPAVRAKLPLSKKVRENRNHTTKQYNNNNEDQNTAKNLQNIKKSSKKIINKKKKRKKKRITPIFIEEPVRKSATENQQEVNLLSIPESPDKQIVNKKIGNKTVKCKKLKNKEVIDYSREQANKRESIVSDNADPKKKVRSWLLASTSSTAAATTTTTTTTAVAAAAIPHLRIEPLKKSKSSPAELTINPDTATPLPTTATTTTATTNAINNRKISSRLTAIAKNKRRIVGDPINRSSQRANEIKNQQQQRLRLQFFYKPPFKFCVRLKKSDNPGQSSSNNNINNNQRVHLTKNKQYRTAMLVRTVKSKKKNKVKKRDDKKTIEQINNLNVDTFTVPSNAPANSDLHTVPSDLEVLLSESEFLFSDS